MLRERHLKVVTSQTSQGDHRGSNEAVDSEVTTSYDNKMHNIRITLMAVPLVSASLKLVHLIKYK